MSGLRGRLERLEGRLVPGLPARSAAGERMREHLARVVALRRGDLDPDQAAETEAANSAIRERVAAAGGRG